MSYNKVLNRPMFRNAALRKGHLNLIRAQDGIMVGEPFKAAQVPAIRKPPTFLERMKVSRPVRFGRELFSIPFNVGMTAGGGIADYLGVEKGFNVPRLALETAGGALAARALPGLAVGSIGFLPTAVGLGTIAAVKNLSLIHI